MKRTRDYRRHQKQKAIAKAKRVLESYHMRRVNREWIEKSSRKLADNLAAFWQGDRHDYDYGLLTRQEKKANVKMKHDIEFDVDIEVA